MKTPREIANEIVNRISPGNRASGLEESYVRVGMIEALRWAAEVSAAQSAESARWFILDKIAELEKS